jgi:N-acetylmuramoyl-L-alanine amidase
MHVFGRLLIATLAATLLAPAGCKAPARPPVDPLLAVNTLVAAPPDFAVRRVGSAAYPLPVWSKFLKGVKVCLDPGHGGDAHKRGFKRGPTGVREAEVNLRVAQYLRESLLAAGAEVRLTRESDVDLSLEARAAVANDWPADLFISVHHNAVDNKPQTNYTTVWYHDSVDHHPANLDLARYLCQGLYDALALPQITDVPLKTDKLMYEAGFAVLRHARVTACLTESSFYTHPPEEQRLRQPEYNLREAYALFLALARYAAAGLPRAALVVPADGRVTPGAQRTLVFQLDDGLRGRRSWGHERNMILTDSIAVWVAGRRVPHEFDPRTYRLTVAVPADLSPGEQGVRVLFQNMNKNSVLDADFAIHLAAGASAPAP